MCYEVTLHFFLSGLPRCNGLSELELEAQRQMVSVSRDKRSCDLTCHGRCYSTQLTISRTACMTDMCASGNISVLNDKTGQLSCLCESCVNVIVISWNMMHASCMEKATLALHGVRLQRKAILTSISNVENELPSPLYSYGPLS